jgi:hypothetical protein
MTANLGDNRHIKHIHICYHFIREKAEERETRVEYCPHCSIAGRYHDQDCSQEQVSGDEKPAFRITFCTIFKVKNKKNINKKKIIIT